MTTIVHSNGRVRADLSETWMETLLGMLASHPLDRTFEAYSDFINPDAVNLRGEPLDGIAGATSIGGNFFTYSHAFRLTTDEPIVIETLAAAIRANQQRDDYLDQAPPFDGRKLEINRKRFSTTQGEVELVYAGERIEQYGDDITLRPNGNYQGHDDLFWHGVARRVLAERHDAARAKAKRAALQTVEA